MLVVIYALQSLGLPIRNINNENNEDEGFFYRAPMALKNGARQGTYRIGIQSVLLKRGKSKNRKAGRKRRENMID